MSAPADCGTDASTVDGCQGCTPGHRVCGADGVPRECDARGARYTAREPCGAGLACAYGQCADLCAQARESNSYAGCEYWAVATTNSELGAISRAPDRNLSEAGAVGVDGFQFALTSSTPGVTTSAAGDAHVVYRVDLSARPGAHHVESEGRRRFSVKVYGFGSYTSYTYPGGLDLTRISPPV